MRSYCKTTDSTRTVSVQQRIGFELKHWKPPPCGPTIVKVIPDSQVEYLDTKWTDPRGDRGDGAQPAIHESLTWMARPSGRGSIERRIGPPNVPKRRYAGDATTR